MQIARVFVPVDVGPLAEAGYAQRALAFAAALAAGFSARVTLFHGVPGVGGVRGSALDVVLKARRAQAEEAEQRLEALKAELGKAHVDVDVLVKTDIDRPDEAILEAAAACDADLIVMASRATASHRVLVGSVATRVLRTSKIPVLLVPTSTGDAG